MKILPLSKSGVLKNQITVADGQRLADGGEKQEVLEKFQEENYRTPSYVEF
jgi:hypothetical protein